MKKLALIAVALFTLTACDKLTGVDSMFQNIVGKITYDYYFKVKGEVKCQITEEIIDGQKSELTDKTIYVTKLQGEKPVVEVDQKITEWRKVVESMYMLNLQHLDLNTGSSQVLILDRESGQLLVTKNLYKGGQLSYEIQRANCK